jgi:uncharacterized membrane protein YhaH (DUF805 family)
MNFVDAVKSVFGKFATFQGRACRSEYWYFYLFYMLVYIVAAVIDAVTGIPVLSLIFALVVMIPFLALTVRRLHDTDRSGWWVLIGLIPLIGAILLLVWFCTRGTTGDNRFGADPLGGEAVPAPAAA